MAGRSSDRADEDAGGRRRLASGVPGLDRVLGGGLLAGGIYLLTGGPGTGKTVLANQMAFARAAEGERCIYLTMLTESHGRMIDNLRGFAFFDPAQLDRITYLSGTRTLRGGGLEELTGIVEEELGREEPHLLVMDGLRIGVEMADASYTVQTAFLNRLSALLELVGCTAVVCSLGQPGIVAPEHALADGLIELTHRRVGCRSVRELFVCKFRGSSVLEGSHVMEIDARGVTVHPRTEALLARESRGPAEFAGRKRFGVERLDEMLEGGLPAASTTAVVGATGAGKTLLGLHFLAEGAAQGERSLYFGFYEGPERVLAQGDGIGLGVSRLRDADALDVVWNRSFEILLDPTIRRLLDHVREREIRRLFIDGAEGFRQGAAFPERAPSAVAALLNELRETGVNTVISVESELLGVSVMPTAPWSALVENAIVLRYVELRSQLRRLLGIVKVRGSDFDASLREFVISDRGIEVAETFESAEAILTGIARVEGTGGLPGRAGGEDDPRRR